VKVQVRIAFAQSPYFKAAVVVIPWKWLSEDGGDFMHMLPISHYHFLGHWSCSGEFAVLSILVAGEAACYR